MEDENFGNFGRFNQLASSSIRVDSDDSVSCKCEFVCVVAVPLFIGSLKFFVKKDSTDSKHIKCRRKHQSGVGERDTKPRLTQFSNWENSIGIKTERNVNEPRSFVYFSSTWCDLCQLDSFEQRKKKRKQCEGKCCRWWNLCLAENTTENDMKAFHNRLTAHRPNELFVNESFCRLAIQLYHATKFQRRIHLLLNCQHERTVRSLRNVWCGCQAQNPAARCRA